MPRLGQRLRPIDPRENKAKCSLPDIGALLSKRNERKRQSQATKQKLVESLKVRYPPESSAQILGKFLYAPVETTEARGALHVSENRPVEDVIAINKKLFERFAEECARESASQLPEDVQAGLLGYDPSAQKPSFRFQMPTTQAYNERTARFKVSQKVARNDVERPLDNVPRQLEDSIACRKTTTARHQLHSSHNLGDLHSLKHQPVWEEQMCPCKDDAETLVLARDEFGDIDFHGKKPKENDVPSPGALSLPRHYHVYGSSPENSTRQNLPFTTTHKETNARSAGRTFSPIILEDALPTVFLNDMHVSAQLAVSSEEQERTLGGSDLVDAPTKTQPSSGFQLEAGKGRGELLESAALRTRDPCRPSYMLRDEPTLPLTVGRRLVGFETSTSYKPTSEASGAIFSDSVDSPTTRDLLHSGTEDASASQNLSFANDFAGIKLIIASFPDTVPRLSFSPKSPTSKRKKGSKCLRANNKHQDASKKHNYTNTSKPHDVSNKPHDAVSIVPGTSTLISWPSTMLGSLVHSAVDKPDRTYEYITSDDEVDNGGSSAFSVSALAAGNASEVYDQNCSLCRMYAERIVMGDKRCDVPSRANSPTKDVNTSAGDVGVKKWERSPDETTALPAVESPTGPSFAESLSLTRGVLSQKLQQWSSLFRSSKLQAARDLDDLLTNREKARSVVMQNPVFLAQLTKGAQAQATLWKQSRLVQKVKHLDEFEMHLASSISASSPRGTPTQAPPSPTAPTQQQQQQQQQKIPSIWDRASQRLEHEEAEKKRCIAAYMRLLFYLAAITAPTSQGQVDVVRAFRELLLTERRVTKRLFFDLLLDVGPRVFASRENMKIVHFLRIELNVSNTSLLRFVKKYRDIGWHIPRELATQLDLNQSKSMRSK